MTGASTAASTMHGHLPALRLLLVCLQPRAMTVHLCSLLCPTTLPAPGLALPARGQWHSLALLWAFPHLAGWRARVAVLTALPAPGQAVCMAGREGTSLHGEGPGIPRVGSVTERVRQQGKRGGGGGPTHTQSLWNTPSPLQAGTRITIIPTKPLQRHVPTSLSSKAKI